jgi:hypothetical protein
MERLMSMTATSMIPISINARCNRRSDRNDSSLHPHQDMPSTAVERNDRSTWYYFLGILLMLRMTVTNAR